MVTGPGTKTAPWRSHDLNLNLVSLTSLSTTVFTASLFYQEARALIQLIPSWYMFLEHHLFLGINTGEGGTFNTKAEKNPLVLCLPDKFWWQTSRCANFSNEHQHLASNQTGKIQHLALSEMELSTDKGIRNSTITIWQHLTAVSQQHVVRFALISFI